MDQIDISYFAKTKSEAIDFADRMGTISNLVYQSGFNLDKALMEVIGMQKKTSSSLFFGIIRYR